MRLVTNVIQNNGDIEVASTDPDPTNYELLQVSEEAAVALSEGARKVTLEWVPDEWTEDPIWKQMQVIPNDLNERPKEDWPE